MFRAVALASVFAASTALSAVVWDLNPNNQHGNVGSSSFVFNSGGQQITARGYDNSAGQGVGRELFFKNRPPDGGANESGLGLVGTPHNELTSSANGTIANFIQLDLRSILTQGAFGGQIAVTSLQNGEGFRLFGSDVQGSLGTALGGAFTGLAFDDKFVAIPNFGSFDFISIVSAGINQNVLPSRFMADFTPIPEVGTVMPIVGLLVAVGTTQFLRRRRLAAAQ